MYFLYYCKNEKIIKLTDDKINDRTHELLETNGSLEKLIVRTEMYKKQYQCDLLNTAADAVDATQLRNLKRKRMRGWKLSDETRHRQSLARQGEKNPSFGRPKSPESIESRSKKLKEYYKVHTHGKKGYKDSEETRKMKSINNNNKGGWYWICNIDTGEEKRWTQEHIPFGWRKGRSGHMKATIKSNFKNRKRP